MRNTIFLQRIDIAPIQKHECAVEPDEFAKFSEEIFADCSHVNSVNEDSDPLIFESMESFTYDELGCILKSIKKSIFY